jgi:hypothetical protein
MDADASLVNALYSGINTYMRTFGFDYTENPNCTLARDRSQIFLDLEIRARVDSGPRPGNTLASALTGRHPPAAREASHLCRLELGAVHLLSAWLSAGHRRFLKGGVVATPRILPSRPSLESLTKQAKKLARELPLPLRAAQLVLAREYGYAGWQELTAEVSKRLGNGLEWAATQARRVIHDNDVERLTQLLAEYPALLSWRSSDKDEGLLGIATDSFGDSFDPFREQRFTRAACAELLIDAGAVVTPSVCDSLIASRARGLLLLFQRKGLLPRTLRFLSALGDLDAVRASLEENGHDLAALNDAFLCACRFQHKAVASFVLERCIALDRDLGSRIDGWQGRAAFIDYLAEHPQESGGPWQRLVMNEVKRTMHEDDLPAFVRWLQKEPYLLGEACVGLQVELLEHAAWNNRGAFITQLLDLDPAVRHCRTPPPSLSLGYALEYGHAHLVPLLAPIWPLPDDLPHAAGVGDFARVVRWFDAAGQPALGDLHRHHPANCPQWRANLQWGAPRVHQVLDVALAWACMNRHFEVASFLLAHGADINTDWSTHEPAGMLHECAVRGNYDAARFLIDRGIDMTRLDYRWNATAQGWARYAANDEQMADFLAAAEREQSRE